MKEMTEKKEESPKPNKRRRNTVENTTVENDSIDVELPKITESKEQEQFSSLDILWKHAFNELDQWAKHADFRDDMLLKEAMCFAESIKRNQKNIKSVREQFNKEFANWEVTAREEFLMSTTVLQHIFPKRSYEEINQQIDQIQKRTASVLSTPLQMVVNNQIMDQYFDMIERYIAVRKKGRKQYVNTLKQAASLIYESQKGFVGLFTGQLKSFMFPLNKYMEKAEEVTKS
jgi:BMFP domain-containing protein YqiC